ncbi:hypothetical protein AB1L42_13530 [Thalassoglobus sp. JC818]|uniref:hypothetical protein n=1 Tax=Thalassoglobus sp. JC818 TaxID=3232136 RepID=UPI00345A24EF
MSSRDETPNFDWLESHQDTIADEPTKPFSATEDSESAESQEVDEAEVSALADEQEAAVEDVSEEDASDSDDSIHNPLPDPEFNVSDGTTLIMKGKTESEDDTDPSIREMSTADQTVVLGRERETFADPDEPKADMKPTPKKESVEPKPAAASTKSDVDSSSRLPMILLISYASLITIIALFLALNSGRSHQLESLPDVAPEPIQELSYVAPKEQLAPGHTLRIGEQQRFGNLLVEPIRVVVEPIEFTHYSGEESRTREPSKPVMKLFLKFTNVSDDQEIAPFDRNLTLRWVRSSDQGEYSNYYLFNTQADANAQPVSTYHLTSSSDWDMKDQQLGKVLQPGESFVTYLASSEDGIESLSGEVAWRFQFRKGFSPSGSGVTTLADVVFDSDSV